MVMYQGIGLERFNSLPRARAVYALFACCSSVTWANKLADERPYADRTALHATADLELSALSPLDLQRSLDSVVREPVSGHTAEELARITRIRIDRMLGPTLGYPEY